MQSVTSTTTSKARARPGRRGAGSKPARSRSIQEFATDFDTVASDRIYTRLARSIRKQDQLEKDKKSGALEARRRDLVAAYDAINAGTADEHQRKLVRKASDAEFFARSYEATQSAYDRIVGTGFVWPGGVVADQYYRKPFVEKGLRTWQHPFFQLVAASTARAWTGRLRGGPTKDGCRPQSSKLHGLDSVYIFFCDECRDMWRLDCDKTFDSEAHMRSWLDNQVSELGLPCGPHLAVWIPCDQRPGKIIKPHWYFLLPETKAVWKVSPPERHRLLGEVIAALTRAFECDPGGLANSFHGKNPLSPLCAAVVIQDTHMPTLGEYAESLDLTYDPEMMLRKLMTERLEAADFDKADSNTWFSAVSALANAGAKTLYKGGADISDREAFQKKIANLITGPALDEIKPSGSQRKTIDKLIETCTKWTAHHFDPSKMDTLGRDRGAAAHLIEDTDDTKTKIRKGQTFACGVKIRKTRLKITAAMIRVLRSRKEPTISSIAEAVGMSYNGVKPHVFACYVTAIASIAFEGLVKGGPTTSFQAKPSLHVLLTANQPSDIPDSWITVSGNPILAEHFRQKAMSLARTRRSRPGRMRAIESLRPAGLTSMAFMSAGTMTVYRRSAIASKAA